jgi:hypothetical protein
LRRNFPKFFGVNYSRVETENQKPDFAFWGAKSGFFDVVLGMTNVGLLCNGGW